MTLSNISLENTKNVTRGIWVKYFFLLDEMDNAQETYRYTTNKDKLCLYTEISTQYFSLSDSLEKTVALTVTLFNNNCNCILTTRKDL